MVRSDKPEPLIKSSIEDQLTEEQLDYIKYVLQ